MSDYLKYSPKIKQTFHKESHKTPNAIRAATKKGIKEGRGRWRTTIQWRKRAVRLKVKYKDVGDDIRNRAMIKVTKQKQVEGEEEEKQRTVSQQKRPQLTEKGK